MVGNKKYYSRRRAEFLIRSLFAWLLLDAHDKGCAQRLFGPRAGATVVAEAAAVKASAPRDALAGLLRSVRECWDALVASVRRALGLARPQRTAADLSAANLQRSGWQGAIVTNAPRQSDETSCGVFMTAFAELALRGWLPPFGFQQADVPQMRLTMAGRLLDVVPMGPLSLGSELQSLDACTG